MEKRKKTLYSIITQNRQILFVWNVRIHCGYNFRVAKVKDQSVQPFKILITAMARSEDLTESLVKLKR